jgi:KDO2-lipid IV(A) lauroyltransferase
MTKDPEQTPKNSHQDMISLTDTVHLGFFPYLGVLLSKIPIFTLSLLPTKVQHALGDFLGSLSFRLCSRRRKIALGNISRVQERGFLPEGASPKEIALHSFRSLSRTFLEILVLYRKGFSAFEKDIRVEGKNHMEEAMALANQRSVGLILLTGHMGNWELAPHVMHKEFGLAVYSIGRTQGSLMVDHLLLTTRSRGGGFIFKDQGARSMLKVLKAKGTLGTLVDQAAMLEREGAPLTFLGLPAYTNLGPMKLSEKTGALLVPLFGRREGGAHVFKIFPAIVPPQEGGEGFVLHAAQEVNDILGGEVSSHPGDWMWSHRRWKTPEGLRKDPFSF